MKKTILLFLLLIYLSVLLHGQNRSLQFFREITLSMDTSVYRWTEHQYEWKGEQHLRFAYQEENPEVEFRFYPIPYPDIDSIRVLPSGSFTVIDSLLKVNTEYYRLKLRFSELTQNNFLALHLQVYSRYLRDNPQIQELRLFPTTRTLVSLQVDDEELFIGEEKVFRVETNNLKNIRISNTWITGEKINYKFSKRSGQLLLHLLPHRLDEALLEASLEVRKPYLSAEGKAQYTLPPIRQTFTIKPAKLAFLNINYREVSLNAENQRQGIEIELDYLSELQMQKTYRLEEREDPGGALIAEIFTRQVLANGKALCWLRLYDYHRRTDGYLYIKDGDKAVFITNVDIVPETKIDQISIRREGQEWKKSTVIYPGEQIDIRLNGQSLHRAAFRFDGLVNVAADTLLRGEQEAAFHAKVPVDIKQRQVQIFNGSQETGLALKVNEYQRPRQFDFIYINYGDERRRLTDINQLIFYPETLQDIIIEFDPELIDQQKLYGEQHLEIEIQVLEKNNQLIDTRSISKILVSPGESSPRYHFYDQAKSRKPDISLNAHLRKKIFDLDIWTSLRIKIQHREETYSEEVFEKTVEFVLFRSMTFNIDVSFPAGLLVKQFEEEGFGNLGGISMAMMAQFSFYRPNSIAKEKPYKFGAGFLAFNAFNFNDNNDNRDVGLVALASFYPIKTKDSSRLSFPLYTGIGYFLSKSKWFVLLGPGIRVQL